MAAVAVALAVSTQAVSALSFYFSFDDNPADNIANRQHVGGTVTGALVGLVDDTVNQFLTGFILTHVLNGLGMTQFNFSSGRTLNFFGSGVSVPKREIIAIRLGVIFTDVGAGGYQLSLNTTATPHFPTTGTTWLIQNGSGNNDFGLGNNNGSAGVTVSSSPISAVPLPAGLWLLGLAVAGMGWLVEGARVRPRALGRER